MLFLIIQNKKPLPKESGFKIYLNPQLKYRRIFLRIGFIKHSIDFLYHII